MVLKMNHYSSCGKLKLKRLQQNICIYKIKKKQKKAVETYSVEGVRLQ